MTTVFEYPKLALFAKTIPGGSFPAKLTVDIYNGNPQLFVLTGNKKGEGVTYIRAGLEPKTLDMICELVNTIADTPTNPEKAVTAKVDCLKEKELVAKVVVGKTKEGMMFLSVLDVKDTSAPVIQFLFLADMFHPVELSWIEGNDAKAQISCAMAKGWAKRTSDLVHNFLASNPPPEKENKGGNGGGYNRGNNNGGYNNNNNNQRSDDNDW